MSKIHSHKLVLVDKRRAKNIIYTTADIKIPKNKKLDNYVYEQYAKLGNDYLNSLVGSFAFIFQSKNGLIFAVRDWIGEMPLHYMIIDSKVYFANFIEDLINIEGYDYEKVTSLNRSQVLTIQNGIICQNLYYNFNKDIKPSDYSRLNAIAKNIRDQLDDSTKVRYGRVNNHGCAILLSGGIDSMSIAYLTSRLSKIPAYTLQIGEKESTDVVRAKMITKYFGIEHRIVKVNKEDIIKQMQNSVKSSEIYHLYNVFCAVGMDILAKKLKSDGIDYVFTGEGGNECFGDYYDWIIKSNGKDVILQTTSKDFETPEGREAYVWGNLAAERAGRYNKQLGSGLGKHGCSRMYKPMYKQGVTLISPYFDKKIMKTLANIPTSILKQIGGKPGFMSLVFSKDIEDKEIPVNFFDVKKIRLQDASESESDSGITETLLKQGFNQAKTIAIYNNIFKSNVREQLHMKETILIKNSEMSKQ